MHDSHDNHKPAVRCEGRDDDDSGPDGTEYALVLNYRIEGNNAKVQVEWASKDVDLVSDIRA